MTRELSHPVSVSNRWQRQQSWTQSWKGSRAFSGWTPWRWRRWPSLPAAPGSDPLKHNIKLKKQIYYTKTKFKKGRLLHYFYYMLPVLWIRIRLDFGRLDPNLDPGGQKWAKKLKKAKMNKKIKVKQCHVLTLEVDVLFWWLKVSPVAWTTLKEA